MNNSTKLVCLGVSIAILMLSGCVVRPVVKPDVHHHSAPKAHVIYHAKQSKKHCWRHKGHWDCK